MRVQDLPNSTYWVPFGRRLVHPTITYILPGWCIANQNWKKIRVPKTTISRNLEGKGRPGSGWSCSADAEVPPGTRRKLAVFRGQRWKSSKRIQNLYHTWVSTQYERGLISENRRTWVIKCCTERKPTDPQKHLIHTTKHPRERTPLSQT